VVTSQGDLNDFEGFIDLGDNFPFAVGLIKLKKLHENSQPLFRLIFKMKSDGKILQNKLEQAEKTENLWKQLGFSDSLELQHWSDFPNQKIKFGEKITHPTLLIKKIK
jgi:hypothetical protein